MTNFKYFVFFPLYLGLEEHRVGVCVCVLELMKCGPSKYSEIIILTGGENSIMLGLL